MQTIGLLGGSFNPAHAGHLHISELALKRLGLDAVWWLVSPHNPLKTRDSLADYEKRVRSAHKAAQHPRIYVSTLEAEWGTQYTYATITRLQQRYPSMQFVWLMGADNLLTFHRWRHWQLIAKKVPIAVFNRDTCHHLAIRSLAARALHHSRVRPRFLVKNQHKTLPRWCFIPARIHPLSATYLRKTLGPQAF